MSIYLPEDVVLKILSMLHPKSFLRLRLVSKSWLFLIGIPYFLSVAGIQRWVLSMVVRIWNRCRLLGCGIGEIVELVTGLGCFARLFQWCLGFGFGWRGLHLNR